MVYYGDAGLLPRLRSTDSLATLTTLQATSPAMKHVLSSRTMLRTEGETSKVCWRSTTSGFVNAIETVSIGSGLHGGWERQDGRYSPKEII